MRDVGIIATIVLVSVILLKFSLKDDGIKVASAGASAAAVTANQSVVNPSSQIAGDFKEESSNLTDTFQALPESSSESIANALEPFWTVSRAIDDTVVMDVPLETEATYGTLNSGTSSVSDTIDYGGSGGGNDGSGSGDSSSGGTTSGLSNSGGGTSGGSASSGSGSTDAVSSGQDSTGVTTPTGGGGGTGGSGTGTSTDFLVNDVTDKTATSTGSVSQSAKLSFSNLPPLNPSYSPLDERNKAALFDRLTMAFDQYYQNNFDPSHNFATTDGDFYYFRQELQGIVDMYYATKKLDYLETAKRLVFKAMADAKSNQRILLWNGQSRGEWPCFLQTNEETGGHIQLNDLQGAAGFMMVASALKKEKISGWQEISDFVERNIIEKWLYYNPNITFEKLTGSQSNTYILTVLETSRDKREHFAGVCLDLSELGYQKYPYRDWSQFLFNIYLTEKTSLNEPYPDINYRSKVPTDWGLYHQKDGTLIWSLGKSDLENYGTLDTSHANRTIWAACQAFEKGLLPKKTTLNNLIVSFKKNIWAPNKGPFHFNNYIDGQDGDSGGWGAGGLKGNVWLGWNRLAAYDNTLKDLFISLAYDLTNGGPNLTGQQNKGCRDAPHCLIAWGARLISTQGNPEVFP